MLPLAVVVVAAFGISYAVADAGTKGERASKHVVVPGTSPKPVSSDGSPPAVRGLGRAAALPALHIAAPKAAPAPVVPRPAVKKRVKRAPTPSPAPVTPSPAPVTPTPTPAPTPKPKPKPPSKEFKSVG